VSDLPVTVIEQTQPYRYGGMKRVELHVVYLGKTALVASSRRALIESLNAQAAQKTLAHSEAFAALKQQTGEIVFFSQMGTLLKDIFGSLGISGKRNPSKSQVKKRAEFFAVTPDFFRATTLD
jgi:hypothetical protein